MVARFPRLGHALRGRCADGLGLPEAETLFFAGFTNLSTNLSLVPRFSAAARQFRFWSSRAGPW
jgi:hypothetical protein